MTGEMQAGGSGIARERRSDDAPAYLVQRTARLLRVLFLKVVDTTETGVTPEMWLVLSRLLARDGQSQTELGEALFRDRPNTSRILNGLEQRGYVRREPDPDDGRRTRIRITPEGRAFVSERAPLAIQVRDRLYEGIKRKRLDRMRKTIREIEENALQIVAELEQGSFDPLEPDPDANSGGSGKKRKKKRKKDGGGK
ncbi:MAG: MarR family transcriptional regulator [Gemmatimonadota bacterium]|jgi:DNA-binding MarR family transcriptional regulator